MKKLFIIICLAGCAICAASQPEQQKPTIVIPGKGNIDVEKLGSNINLQQDISQLSLSELRVLRNAFAARQGYCFMQADLRDLFGATSWYTQVMEDRFFQEESGKKIKPISYTPAEQAFINKLKKREEELRKQNFKTADGEVVNVENIVNPYQLNNFEEPLRKALARQGFAIVPADELQLFHVYERNDYHEFPSFVTTDLYLQAFHIFFDTALKQMERNHFYPQLEQLLNKLYAALCQIGAGAAGNMKDAAMWDATYIDIAHALLTGKPLQTSDTKWRQMAEQELRNVDNAANTFSDFLEMYDVYFNYSIHRPRGHYTRSEELKRYFSAMMWLQNVFFGTEKPQFLRRALLLANVVGSSSELTNDYNTLTEPITFLMGQPDNISILQVYDELIKSTYTLDVLMQKDKPLKQVQKAIETVANKQTRIRPKFLMTSPFKINFMPQRYMPDSEVLQEMVDYDNNPTLRDVPNGLDVLAAMGVGAAERILIQERHEQERWPQFNEMLGRMKQHMSQTDWQQTVANRWTHSLTTLFTPSNPEQNVPYFMLTPQWQKKNLNTALASWAELKHDAILYAKQPMGAECGAGGPPEPVVRGYVEPNIAYWQTAIDLLDATSTVFKKYGLSDEKTNAAFDALHEQAEFLLAASLKEIQGKRLSDEEYAQIEYIGASFEDITLGLIAEPDQWLDGWDNVEGADKSIAVVADVYTANAFNNPKPSVLYEAVGPAHEIYVVVEIEGLLYLTRGAVFSYREFQEDIAAPRTTDEEWQQQLKSQPDKGIPNWMKEIIVPMGGKEIDNEHVFYSSGC